MIIEALSKKTLGDAIHLLEKTFPYSTPDDNPSDSLNASLNPQHYKTYLDKTGSFGNKYWVLIDRYGVLRGISGLHYHTMDCDEAVWGGWTAVDQTIIRSCSKKSVELLRYVLDKAIHTKKSYLRLYFFNEDINGMAYRLYQRVNPAEFKRTSSKVYFQIDLAQLRT